MSFRLRIRVLIVLLSISAAIPAAIYAHPMGNFSISHYSAIRIERIH